MWAFRGQRSQAVSKVVIVTESTHPVGDAAAMLRSATESIVSRPPSGLAPILGVAWSCFTLLRACAGHLATEAPSQWFQLYHEIEVRAWLAKHALDQAPSTPSSRRPLLHSWVDLGDTGPVVEAITELTGELHPVLVGASASLAEHLPDRTDVDRMAVDFAALDRAVLDHAVLGSIAPDHCDLDLRALGVASSVAQLIAADLRENVPRRAV